MLMPAIQLYTTYYNEKNELRKNGLLACVKNNAQNPFINSVTVLNEGDDLSSLSEKIVNRSVTKRPTYNDFIQITKQNSQEDTIHIIANTDIYFDRNIGVLWHLDLKNTCITLARWDTTESEKPILYNHNDSQDVWIFKGAIKSALNADFPLGVPRCDNRFLFEIEQSGYKVLNPSFSIRAFHMHKGQREVIYSESDNTYKIEAPYRFKYPHNWFGLWQTLLFNATHTTKLAPYRYDIKKINRWWIIKLYRKIYKTITHKPLPLIGYSK